MSQFYMSIMFIGIVLIVVTFICILFDKKRCFDYSKGINEKKEEMYGIVEDAEKMLEELNRFSDYVVGLMESKSEELNNILTKIDEKIAQHKLRHENAAEYTNSKQEKVTNVISFDLVGISGPQFEGIGKEQKAESTKPDNQVAAYVHNQHQTRMKENVIPLNGKYNEVLKLSEDGLNETEIAKKLNMGKGEIQLVLGMIK
jgi:uncharacterized protein YoxC